jgi:hypothetical protein
VVEKREEDNFKERLRDCPKEDQENQRGRKGWPWPMMRDQGKLSFQIKPGPWG